jgi:replication factor C subunit 2/4
MATTVVAEGVPWVEKYRPATIADVVHQQEVVQTLRRAIDTQAVPHLLFYGSPGTGKTSTILAVARELYRTPELLRERVLELNASDERGIDVIRHKVKEFAMAAASSSSSSGGVTAAVAPFKIVVLDEADSMTQDAQNALRRTMEVYSHSTRFCLLCNYISRIIEPLASRCAKFRFRSIPEPLVVARLRHVAAAERFAVPDEAVLVAIARVCGGDLRRAITSLQTLAAMYGSDSGAAADGGDSTAGFPSVQAVYEMSGVVPDETVQAFFGACQSNSFEQLEQAARQIEHGGFAADQFLTQLHDMVMLKPASALDDSDKATALEAIAEAEKCLIDGADEFLQVFAVGSKIMRRICVSSSSSSSSSANVATSTQQTAPMSPD